MPLITLSPPPPPPAYYERNCMKDAPVLKVKVGGSGTGPSADAARALELLRGSPIGSTLRLDANQAWTMEEALCFATTLAASSAEASGATGTYMTACGANCLGSVEYVEEPLRNPRFLGKFWELSGGVLPYALDESLGMGREAFTDDVSCVLVSRI